MKKISLLPLIFSLCFMFSSCKKDAPLTTDNNTDQQSAVTGKQTVIPPGEILFPTCNDWKIATFIQQENNMTNKFAGVTFKFCPDNTVRMFNDILAINGHWYFMLDKGNATDLTLDFDFQGSMPDWAAIEGTWKVIKLTETSIQVQSQDGSALLTFERK